MAERAPIDPGDEELGHFRGVHYALEEERQRTIEAEVYGVEQEELATHDELTGLLNRRGFKKELERMIADYDPIPDPSPDQRAERRQVRPRGATVLIIDLEDFKSINDALGIEGGDRVIQRFSEILEDTVRDDDVVSRINAEQQGKPQKNNGEVARFGGDEFAIFLQHTSEAGAMKFLERLESKMRRNPIAGQKLKLNKDKLTITEFHPSSEDAQSQATSVIDKSLGKPGIISS